ncbi:MAG: hypothetical protein HEQ35_11135 [Gloeotrichia echinulata IR180]|jgi:hypothetical protein
MRITSGIDFLPGKNKFLMDDESLGFSANIFTVLTINAISENQANRYMLQEEDLGLGNQDSCPWKECKTKKTTEFLRLFLMNWESYRLQP